jgi:hypothetical protein
MSALQTGKYFRAQVDVLEVNSSLRSFVESFIDRFKYLEVPDVREGFRDLV